MIRTAVKAIGSAALLLGALTASSEPESWMRKDRPNELALTVAVNPDCSVERDTIERLVLRSFAKQWIERIDVMPDTPYLHVEVWCEKLATLYPYTVVARFVALAAADDARPRSLGIGHESAGATSYTGLRRAMDAVVRRALEDHISANFGL